MQDDDLVKIIVSRQAWQQHLGTCSEARLQGLTERVSTYRDDYQAFVDRINEALVELQDHIKERADEKERAARKKRVGETRIQLREFLERRLPDDRNLEQLELCTKSGATVRLDALTFTLNSQARRVTRVSEARELLRQGMACSACWDLYYIRSGTRSAGYGWERPFLDELFVLERFAKD
jgi:hypothetical protein